MSFVPFVVCHCHWAFGYNLGNILVYFTLPLIPQYFAIIGSNRLWLTLHFASGMTGVLLLLKTCIKRPLCLLQIWPLNSTSQLRTSFNLFKWGTMCRQNFLTFPIFPNKHWLTPLFFRNPTCGGQILAFTTPWTPSPHSFFSKQETNGNAIWGPSEMINGTIFWI